jgi:hypothetical protein
VAYGAATWSSGPAGASIRAGSVGCRPSQLCRPRRRTTTGR